MYEAYVVITVPGALAVDLQKSRPETVEGADIRRAVQGFGAQLSVGEGTLSSGADEVMQYVSIICRDFKEAVRLADRLRGLAGVARAFPKPMEELP